AAVPDPLYGYGLVDAAAAVSADVDPVTENPLGSLADWVALNRRAEADPLAAALPQLRTAIGRTTGPTPFGMPAPGSAPPEPILPVALIVTGVGTALATLAAAGVIRFVTRTRTE
ncbi:MAG: peptidase S8, partial [Yonghaparkia sp.]|nr:peptidase S8 [Microcella sp.]